MLWGHFGLILGPWGLHFRISLDNLGIILGLLGLILGLLGLGFILLQIHQIVVGHFDLLLAPFGVPFRPPQAEGSPGPRPY